MKKKIASSKGFFNSKEKFGKYLIKLWGTYPGGTITIFDLKENFLKLINCTEDVSVADMLPDGRLAVASYDGNKGNITIYNLEDESHIEFYQGGESVNAIACFPNSDIAVSHCYASNGTIRIYEGTSGKLKMRFTNDGAASPRVGSMKVIEDKLVVGSCDADFIRIYDQTGKLLTKFSQHGHGVFRMAILPNGHIATVNKTVAGEQGCISIYNPNDGSLISRSFISYQIYSSWDLLRVIEANKLREVARQTASIFRQIPPIQCGSSSFFMPPEIGVKIAAKTAEPYLDELEAEKIAYRFYGRP